ncbi:hypothetical protein A9Q84_13435 [Halobacteriovorax marinus]|uniref:HD-GYP domain-containing protein n=1 Tax=Halobacteriovorax marinus TaxID=97084 RepID=A0A1Y5FCZ9_9BACT|nr:hypothetical protein A9Q84_13435 [Halobacteriovorax marinus]
MSYIIVSSDERFSKAFSLRLQAKIGVSSILQPSLEQARGFLDILADVEGIILLKPVPETEFQYFIDRASLDDLEVLIPDEQIASTESSSIKRWKLHDDIIELLGTTENPLELDYFSFSLSHLSIFNIAPVDYYMMLGDDRKYLKIINKGETDLKKHIAQLHKKEIGQIYIEKSDVPALLERIEDLMKDEFSKSPIDPIKLQEQTYQVLKQLGLSDFGLQLARTSVDSLIESIDSKDDTKGFLNSLYTNSNDRSYQLTYMTSLMSINVLAKFDWATDSMKKDLAFASLFNDLGLSGELVFVRGKNSLGMLSSDVAKKVKTHAYDTYEGLLKQKQLELGEAATIILQHHGSVNGQGFGSELDLIRPLSALFLVCEEFCVGVINSKGGKVNIVGILSSIKKTYRGKSVDKYCSVILDLFKAS